jgi:hypothetical protein
MNFARAYRTLLWLYPRDYTMLFTDEMVAAFERAGEERSRLGRTAYVRFALAELVGLAMGAVGEWVAKFTTSASVRGRCLPDLRRMRPAGVPRELWFAAAAGSGAPRDVPDEVVETQRHIDSCLRRMQHAIAKHDFEGARFYSNEDLKGREKLRMLREKYGSRD